MRMMLRPVAAGVALLMLTILAGSVSTCAAPVVPPAAGEQMGCLTEEQKIEKLIGVIAGLKDASFVRKGKGYDAATAARFLRDKWNWIKSDELRTARDFVKVASGGNAGTGTPYFITFGNGRTVGAGEYLGDELAKMEGAVGAETRPAN